MKSLKTIINEAQTGFSRRDTANQRMTGKDLVWDKDEIGVVKYMLNDPKFKKHAGQAGYESGEDIYFDDDALVFGDKTVAIVKKNTTIDDLIKAVLKRKKLPKHPNWTPAFGKELKRRYG